MNENLITIGYEVRETRQLTAAIKEASISPTDLVIGLNEGRYSLSGDRTAIVRNGTVIADISADEALSGCDYNLPRDFSLEDGEPLRPGDACPSVSCGGHLGQTTEDGLTCPECGLSWNNT